jgi:hypothetical protein
MCVVAVYQSMGAILYIILFCHLNLNECNASRCLVLSIELVCVSNDLHYLVLA